MTIKEAILKSMNDLGAKVSSGAEIYQNIIEKRYYDFGTAGTPRSTVHGQLGDFIRKGDSRVKRIKDAQGKFQYFLTKNEEIIDIKQFDTLILNSANSKKPNSFRERDLHLLLSSYLKNISIYSKTIFHERSKNSSDSHQKWVHPDMVGIKFLTLQNKNSQSLIRSVNKLDVFKLYSYELKKEISTDYDLKKYYFQAVSNSSWANYGYLVAFDINSSLQDEMERLNQSFGIGIIELSPNPFESKLLFNAKLKSVNFKTLDKLCEINRDFEHFIEQIEKLLSATDRYYKSTEKEFESFCDPFLIEDTEILSYCEKHNIPVSKNDEELYSDA